MSAELAAECHRARARRAARRSCSSSGIPSRSPRPRSARSTGRSALDPATGQERAVAVKVQYPGVDEAIAADLRNADLLGALLQQGFSRPRPRRDGRRDQGTARRGARLRARGAQPAASSPTSTATIRSSTCPTSSPSLCTRARADHRARRRRDLVRAADVAAGRARPRRRVPLPLRLPQPLPDAARSTATRTPATTCSTATAGSRSSTSAWSSTSARPRSATFVAMVKAAAYDHDAAAFRASSKRPGCSARDAPVTTEEVGDYFTHFYAPVARGPR